jgi:prepilin-type processing-associated H-X9-DG protein
LLERLVLSAVLFFPGNVLAAGELRSLFHTAHEREQLDRMRCGEPVEGGAEKSRVAPVVTGFVKRTDGRNTVWLDGHAVTGTEANRLADAAHLRDTAHKQPRAIEVRPSR